MTEWWLEHGWRDLLLGDYGVTLVLSLAWFIAALIVRRSGRVVIAPHSSFWLVPVFAWGLQSIMAALTTTQLDLVANTSRVPFMWMYAASGAVAGACVAFACALSERIRGASPSTGSGSRNSLRLCLGVGAASAATWTAVLIREAVLVGRP